MDEGGVRDLYGRMLDAWNSRDPDAFASLFAPDGTLVGFDGSVAVGQEIADHLRPIFADHPTAGYVAKIRSVRPAGAEVAVLRAIVGMVPPGRHQLDPDTNAQQTLVAERDADVGWRIVLFQNTPAQYHGRPELSAAHTAELEPLVR